MTSKIDLSIVQTLRNKTGAGIGMCMEVLKEANGDIEKAEDLLRQRGALKASKKYGNATNYGVVAVSASSGYNSKDEDGIKKVALLELHCETDFLAKNMQFVSLAEELSSILLSSEESTLDGFLDYKITKSDQETKKGAEETIKEKLIGCIATFGENINLGKVVCLSTTPQEISYYYIHNKLSTAVGNIITNVSISSDKEMNSDEREAIHGFVKALSMHVAAYKPKVISRDDIPESDVKKVIEAVEQRYEAGDFKKNGKNGVGVEVIVKNELNRMYAECTLLEQPFLLDNKKSVKEVLEKYQRDFGKNFKISNMIRIAVGEE